MKSSLFAAIVAVLLSSIIAITAVHAQGGQTFRGAAQSVSGGVLTVSGGGETHRFQITGSTKITGPSGKSTSISNCLNQSVEVTYSGNKEPYHAISVAALEQD
jgi:hypothetical protein